jgi:class 3 adenylate cyclase/tetratricopeptide (TPR) repeat protein
VPHCWSCGSENPERAKFCSECGAERAGPPQAPAVEERKLATVLFADLVGSTQNASAQDPERTRAALDRFYDAMAAEIERAGGTVEKFVGDAVMAAFGAPAAQEDHAERALHAALAMRRRLDELFGDTLSIRIGVNTGEVVVGRAREGSSFVTGDAVNVCARLEQAAAPGEILVGERTAAAVQGAFELDEPRTLEAKGKVEGVVGRRLVRALTLMRPRGIGGLHRAFVGRETELEFLRASYRRTVDDGEPHLITIAGDAGVGKTRLVRELWVWLAEQDPQPLQRTGRCLSYGQGFAYWPLAEVLKEQFGLLDTDPPERVLEHLGEQQLLGLTLGLDVAGGLHPLVARDRFQDAWTEFLTELAAKRPTALLVEDLHWAETPLLDLLEWLLERVRGPLLLIATTRPELVERRPGWGSGTGASVLDLEPLSAQDSELLVGELLATEVPGRLRQLLVDRSEGNPFFVEELIGILIDRGLLTRANGNWTVSESASEIEIPDSVQALLAARIDLLGPADKEALQTAAVIGRVFWTGPVYELLACEPDFRTLEERDFIRLRPGSSIPGQREYVIKHALTREVAYASLPRARRCRLHAAFARWLERFAGAAGDEYAPLLAHHYAEAVRPEDVDLAWSGAESELVDLQASAVLWLRRAAELAVGRYEIDEGLALLERAVVLEPDPSEQAWLWEEIGHANVLKFDGEAFRNAMETAIELAGPSAERYTELALQTARRTGMWQKPPDRELVDLWIERALELAPEGSPTHAKALAAVALWRKDEAAARNLYTTAVRLGDVALRSSALAALADVAWSAEDVEQARAWVQERLALLPELTDPDDRHFAYMSAVAVDLATGRLSEAARSSMLLTEMVEGLTPHHRVHGFHMRIYVDTLAGRWAVVRGMTKRSEEAVEANAATPCTANYTVLLSLAVASEHCGDDAEARRLEAHAHTYLHRRRIPEPADVRLALARNDLAQLRLMLDSPSLGTQRPFVFDGAAARLDALVALGERERIESEAPQWVREGTYIAPFALRALGVARNDSRLLHEAATRFAAMGLEWDAGRTGNLAA